MPIAAAHFHVALEIYQFYGAIAGVQVHAALTRHVDFDLNLVAAPTELDNVNIMRVAHLQLNRIPALLLNDLDPMLADFVMLCRDVRLDGVLVPCVNADVGIRGLNPQVGRPRDCIGIRPFIGVSGGDDCQTESERPTAIQLFFIVFLLRFELLNARGATGHTHTA